MVQFLWICLGGAIGTGLRHLACCWARSAFGTAFPYGTLLVNVVGSFAIALLMVLGLETTRVPPTVHVALTTGLLGGFTTFSAFSYETMRCLQNGEVGTAVLNVAVSVAAGLTACYAGWLVGRSLAGT